MSTVGVVVIGRNEGERLRRCLESVRETAARVVYVDSGSTDGSAALAEALGAEVVALDLSVPFTAARARNAGFARLRDLAPDVDYVQFVDGDCEIVSGWIGAGQAVLDGDPSLGVVSGRCRERRPEASVYNQLCDLEWDTPVGESTYCGGIAMMRARAFIEAGAFREDLIAGEEPEFCFRLRQKGYRILRIDAEMTLHDAAMTRFGQWWKRAARCGFAFAEGAAIHGRSPERYCVRENRSSFIWGLVLPLAAVLPAPWTHGASLLLLAAYALPVYKTYRWQRSRGYDSNVSAVYAAACTLAKLPQVQGALRYYCGAILGRRSKIIEYK